MTEMPGLSASTGAADAGKIPQLDSSGKLDTSMMPVGVGPSTLAIMASEALSASDAVNIWNDSGVAKVRKADASTTGKECHGFILAAVASGQNGSVYTDGAITGLSGLTPGARMYLSASTPGQLTDIPPSGYGNVVQFVGVAVSATVVNFEPTDGVVIA